MTPGSERKKEREKEKEKKRKTCRQSQTETDTQRGRQIETDRCTDSVSMHQRAKQFQQVKPILRAPSTVLIGGKSVTHAVGSLLGSKPNGDNAPSPKTVIRYMKERQRKEGGDGKKVKWFVCVMMANLFCLILFCSILFR